MDSNRFDTIVRRLGDTSSRRNALKTFAAAGVGLGLAGAGLSTTLAGPKKSVTTRCKKTVECKAGLQCKNANSQNHFPVTEKRCCKPDGARCNDGFECCGVDVICNGHYCQSA